MVPGFSNKDARKGNARHWNMGGGSPGHRAPIECGILKLTLSYGANALAGWRRNGSEQLGGRGPQTFGLRFFSCNTHMLKSRLYKGPMLKSRIQGWWCGGGTIPRCSAPPSMGCCMERTRPLHWPNLVAPPWAEPFTAGAQEPRGRGLGTGARVPCEIWGHFASRPLASLNGPVMVIWWGDGISPHRGDIPAQIDQPGARFNFMISAISMKLFFRG